tara:strand:+ start:5314 stop:5913 length:600 start_codon:yes stop_codon:yes gene_type:complete
MKLSNIYKLALILLILPFIFLSCKGPDGKFKLPGGDARKTPADPAKRVEQNIREGKGFRLNDTFKNKSSGVFEFASSNGLWKASLDVIDFMPLSSVNYSGGIIVTDWYSENSSPNESIKISIRFLTNEIRSDALDVKIFNRKCTVSLIDCKFSESSGDLSNEIKREILKKAAIYKAQIDEKNPSKDYKIPENFGNLSDK